MDITKFVLSGRDQALIYGDYSTYRTQLSRRILSTRKNVGRTTKKGARYSRKAPVTAQDIADNNEFVYLLLLTSERAWTHAMCMKSAHATDTKGISGSTRSHIISRLHKAAKNAEDLLKALEDQSVSKASQKDILESRAYAVSLVGAEDFEKQSWESCVKSYSEAWIIYTSLATSTINEIFKDLLSSTIEPSIRYGAYQLRIPRTVAIVTIARKYFPRTDSELVSEVEKLDSSIFRETSQVKVEPSEPDAASRTITWRSRQVDLEDASIATALGIVSTATKALSEKLSSIAIDNPKERAVAYDGILIASQDAVDATKHAIDELIAEGIGQGDKRMQGLQITRTAVSYEMISWRIGRNRVLTGQNDGALPDSGLIAPPRKSKKKNVEGKEKEVGIGRKLSRLRESVVLYDSTLQSLDSVRELPGVAADAEFLQEIEAKYNYFRALKCLAIARSYDFLSDHKNALALLARASELSSKALPVLSSLGGTSASIPPDISISCFDAQQLHDLLMSELQRNRALIELSNISSTKKENGSSGHETPLIERLNTYSSDGVDLSNLVTFPPRLEPVPVKPLFFDAAWNYIEYPGEASIKATTNFTKASEQTEKAQEQATQQRKGWFGFGR